MTLSSCEAELVAVQAAVQEAIGLLRSLSFVLRRIQVYPSLLGACFANGWRNFDPCAWSLASEALSFADLAALLHLDISGQLTGSETTQVFDWTGFDEPGKPR